MSDPKQPNAPEGAVEMSNEDLDAVVGGLLPAVPAAAAQLPAAQSGHPATPGQQQGIIAVLIG